MKKVYFVIGFCLLASVAYAGQRAVNDYKTAKLSRSSLLFSCNDEREPVIHKMENTTMIIVTCKEQ